MVIEPPAGGPCEIELRFTGGTARTVTRGLSLLAMLAAALYAVAGRRAFQAA
jgi:hypothetical protein